MNARFSILAKVWVTREEFGKYEGFVIGAEFRDDRWIYKLSIAEDPMKPETFDNWIPEECLELAR